MPPVLQAVVVIMMMASTRTLPHNLEAERSVLGAILIDNSTFGAAAAVIEPAHFFRVEHGRIFARIGDLDARHEPVDLVTLKEELEQNGELEAVGGPAYIASLIDGVPRSTNVEYYAGIVKEKAELRAFITAGWKTIEAAYAADPAPVDDLRAQLLEQCDRRDRCELAVLDAGAILDAPPPVELAQGIAWADSITVLVGESSAGKSFVLLSLAAHIAAGHNWNGRTVTQGSVAYLAFEADAIALRLRALREHKAAALENLFILRPRDPLTPQLARDGETPSRGERHVSAALRKLQSKLTRDGRPPLRLVIIDTVRSSHSGSEDRSEDVAAYVRAVRRLLPPGAAAILAHHSGWQDGDNKRKRERGSSSWRGQVEATLYLEAGDYDQATGEAQLTLTASKARDGERLDPLRLIRRRVELGPAAGQDRTLTSCVIERDARSVQDRDLERQSAAAVVDRVTDLRTLRTLQARPDLTSISQLRQALGGRTASVSISIARLIQEGLVTPGQRGKPFTITQAGQSALREDAA